jgi:hypothetical protein
MVENGAHRHPHVTEIVGPMCSNRFVWLRQDGLSSGGLTRSGAALPRPRQPRKLPGSQHWLTCVIAVSRSWRRGGNPAACRSRAAAGDAGRGSWQAAPCCASSWSTTSAAVERSRRADNPAAAGPGEGDFAPPLPVGAGRRACTWFTSSRYPIGFPASGVPEQVIAHRGYRLPPEGHPVAVQRADQVDLPPLRRHGREVVTSVAAAATWRVARPPSSAWP